MKKIMKNYLYYEWFTQCSEHLIIYICADCKRLYYTGENKIIFLELFFIFFANFYW